MLKNVVFAGVLFALGVSVTARGQDNYQSDIRFDFLNDEDATSPAHVETSIKSLGYRYYFKEIDAMEGPYVLQPFLQRASWAEASFVWFADDDVAANKMEGSGFHVGGRVVIPDVPVGIDIDYTTLDGNVGGGADMDLVNMGGLGAVVWLDDDSRFAAEVGFERMNTKNIAFDNKTFRIGARGIIPIQDMNLEVALHYATVSLDAPGAPDINGLEIMARFFFNKEIFAGLSFSTVDPDVPNGDTDNWELSGGYTFPFGLDLAVSIGEGRVPGQTWMVAGDDPTFGVNVGYRF